MSDSINIIVTPQGGNQISLNPNSKGPQGAQGATGPQGAQGVQGAQGNRGYQGATGSQGAQGNQGYQGYGLQGPQGAQGRQGFQGAYGGPQGAQGATGNQGSQGAQGNQGFQGAYGGPQGAQGATGSTGPAGPTGATGSQGPKGYQGIQGATGNQGSQGFTGPQGQVGPAGTGTWNPSFVSAASLGANADFTAVSGAFYVVNASGASSGIQSTHDQITINPPSSATLGKSVMILVSGGSVYLNGWSGVTSQVIYESAYPVVLVYSSDSLGSSWKLVNTEHGILKGTQFEAKFGSTYIVDSSTTNLNISDPQDYASGGALHPTNDSYYIVYCIKGSFVFNGAGQSYGVSSTPYIRYWNSSTSSYSTIIGGVLQVSSIPTASSSNTGQIVYYNANGQFYGSNGSDWYNLSAGNIKVITSAGTLANGPESNTLYVVDLPNSTDVLNLNIPSATAIPDNSLARFLVLKGYLNRGYGAGTSPELGPSSVPYNFYSEAGTGFYNIFANSGVLVTEQSSDPIYYTTAGQIYYNTTSNTLKFYNGSQWRTLSSTYP